MHVTIAISLLAAQVTQAVVISEDWAAPDQRPARAAKPAELADQRIRQAVADTIAATPDKASVPASQQEVLSAESYRTFTKEFTHAKVPSCLGADGLKFQPPTIGPIGFGSLLALPFVVLAAARGKCN